MRVVPVAVALIGLFASTALARPAADWIADLDHLARELPRRHAEPTAEVDAKTFALEVADLRRRLPALDDGQAIAGLMSLTALFGDGHTDFAPLQTATGFARVPLVLYLFEDGGVRVVGALPDNRDLLGARLVGVGGLGVEEVIQRLEPLMSADLGNTHEREHAAPELLLIPGLLAAVGVTPAAGMSYAFAFDDGRRIERTLGAMAVSDYAGIAWARLLDGREPLRSKDRAVWYSLTRLDDGALYVKLDRCSDQPGRPSLGKFLDDLARQLRATPAPRVIVDLRQNTGGNYDKVKGLARVLERDGTAVRVLVSRHTYSASVLLAADLRHRLDAKLIGETPRARPNRQGEVESFQLPRSKLVVNYSTEYHRAFPELGEAVELPLDERIPVTWADYIAGHDAALAAARR